MKKFALGFIVLLFVLSRWYIFTNPPASYSDVKADYERYANMWRYGTPPYLKHLYEYPPATIPLLATPLNLDQAGIGKYYQNFRSEILIIDIIFFAYLVFIVYKLPWLKGREVESLLMYIALSTFGKDFFYEGIDLTFTACATIAFTLLYFANTSKNVMKNWAIEVLIWTFFWLSVGIKFLTLPLAAPLFLFLHRGKIIQQSVACAIGFLIIWGAPLIMYRSSMQVMFVHNNNRPIKYASFPAHIIRWVDSFTDTEEQIMVAPDFEYQGPVSKQVTAVNKVLFPLFVLSTIGAMCLFIFIKTSAHKNISVKSIQTYLFNPVSKEREFPVITMLWFYLIYMMMVFITAKIFSQPFHIWYMAPLALLSIRSRKLWYSMGAMALLMIMLDMTTLLHIKNNFKVGGKVEIALIRDSFRFIPMFVLLFLGVKEVMKDHLVTKVTYSKKSGKKK